MVYCITALHECPRPIMKTDIFMESHEKNSEDKEAEQEEGEEKDENEVDHVANQVINQEMMVKNFWCAYDALDE